MLVTWWRRRVGASACLWGRRKWSLGVIIGMAMPVIDPLEVVTLYIMPMTNALMFNVLFFLPQSFLSVIICYISTCTPQKWFLWCNNKLLYVKDAKYKPKCYVCIRYMYEKSVDTSVCVVFYRFNNACWFVYLFYWC